MPVHENPASEPPAAAKGAEEAPKDKYSYSAQTIDEVEAGLACCTLCPPRIRFVCCTRNTESMLERKAATMGFFGSSRRKCNDLCCIVLFALFWCGMLGIGGFAISAGNPTKVLYGTDYRGETCGFSEDVKDLKLTAYPRLIEDAILNAQKTDVSDWSFYGVCVAKCPGRLSVLCNQEIAAGTSTNNASQVKFCLTDGLDGTAPVPSDWCSTQRVSEKCWIVPMETRDTLLRCIPVVNTSTVANVTCTYPPGISDPNAAGCLVRTSTTQGTIEEPAQESKLLQQLASVQSLWGRYFGDITRAFVPIMVCSVFVAIILGFAFLLLLQYLTWFVVIFTILGTIFGLAGAAVFCFIKAGILTAPALAGQVAGNVGFTLGAATQDSSQTAYGILGYVFVAMAIAALVLAVVLRNAIATTVSTITLAANAVASNMPILLIPLANTAAILALLAWWGFAAASLMSITSPVEVPGFSNTSTLGQSFGFNTTFSASGFTELKQDTVLQYLQVYNLFGLLWTGQFIIYTGFLITSGTVGSWYFARNKGACKAKGVPVFEIEDEASPCCGLCACGIFRTRCCLSCHRTFRFHLGSVAFASLIVAIIAALRLFVAYVQSKLEQALGGNQILRCVLCYIQCCLAIIDCIVRTISRTAFVFVAIKGHSFIPAGGKSLAFILGNLATFGALNVLSTIILFLGKLLIAGCSAAACWAFLERPDSGYEVTSTWLPAAVTFVFAYLVGAVFMDVYDASIDTILVAYVMDKSENVTHMHARDGGDGADIAKEVDDAQGVKDGTVKPKSGGGCRICCCCCRLLCGVTKAPEEAEVELADDKSGAAAAGSPAPAAATARPGADQK